MTEELKENSYEKYGNKFSSIYKSKNSQMNYTETH